MAPTTAKSAVAGKQQTRLNFKNVRKNASGNLKQSKPSLVMAAASKATAKSKITKKQATRASDASSIELDECVQEELPEIEGMESGSESVRYIVSLSHKPWLNIAVDSHRQQSPCR